MNSVAAKISAKIPQLSLAFFVGLIVSMAISSLNITTTSMLVVSIVMFFTCWTSAAHLLGVRSSAVLVFIALAIGFTAEFLGTKYGWVFGGYQFTDVLNPRVLGVPLVIPVMWFNLVYICYVIANLLIGRKPMDHSTSIWSHLAMSFLVAMLVTAYDLAADPYMVYVVKAWTMDRADGWWFGQTIHGFFGWLGVSFLITFVFRLYFATASKGSATKIPKTFTKWHAMVPVAIYGCWMGFQIMYGYPMETRVISAFAMGIPLLTTLIGSQNWKWD